MEWSLELRPQGVGVLQREVLGCWLGDAPGGSPFGTTQQGYLEAGAQDGVNHFRVVAAMAQHVNEYTSLAITYCPHYWLVAAVLFDGGKDFHVASRTPQFGVDFVLEVFPARRKALHDGMSRCAGINDGLVLQPVVASISGGVVVDVLPVFPVDERPPTLVASVPGAQSGHLVVGRPVFHGMMEEWSTTTPPPSETYFSKALRTDSFQVAPP